MEALTTLGWVSLAVIVVWALVVGALATRAVFVSKKRHRDDYASGVGMFWLTREGRRFTWPD